jgi:hypothetical protein
MGSRHLRKVDRFAILVYCAHGAISLVIAEAVLDTYNDPARDMLVVAPVSNATRPAYHRLVKTTPKPSATKNSRGELPGVLLFLPSFVAVGWAPEAVPVGSDMSSGCDV